MAVSEDRSIPAELTASRGAAGNGGGSENSRDDRSSRAVGELSAFDMFANNFPPNCPEGRQSIVPRPDA